MMKPTVPLLAIAAAAGITLTSVGADDDRVAELERVVQSLQQEVQELRGGDDWLDEERAEEIRSLVQDVLADADTRASLLQSGMSAGYDGGFVLGSADGAFALKINGQIQARYIYNSQDDAADDANRSGFEMRRTKLKFKGHVGDPSFEYMVNGGFDRDGGAFELEDAVISKKLDGGLKMYVGQLKAPYMREELVSSSRQLTVDRSLVNEEFNQDRSVGIGMEWMASDTVKINGMYHNGHNSDKNPWNTEDTEFAADVRAEFLLAGDWGQFKSMTSKQGSEYGLLIGVATHYEVEEYGTASADEVTNMGFTADLSVHMDGANVFAAFVWENYDDDNNLDADRYGIVVQGGLYLNADWELFARYEYGDYDSDSVEELSVITVGVNRYFSKQVKWTTDFGLAPMEVDSVWSSSGVGWRTDPVDEDGQMVLRSQLQLTF